METLRITAAPDAIAVDDFPDAVKIVRLEGPKAKRLSDLALHRTDLAFAATCLAQINPTPAQPPIARQALWRCAIIHYVKCFGDSESRFQLNAEKVYAREPLAMLNFRYFVDLRNKHFVHDENSYAQSIPGAVLNREDKPYKIEEVVSLSAIAETLEQNNYSNLHALIQKALAWVTADFDVLCDIITNDLEKEPYAALLARPGISFTAPALTDVGNKRGFA